MEVSLLYFLSCDSFINGVKETTIDLFQRDELMMGDEVRKMINTSSRTR